MILQQLKGQKHFSVKMRSLLNSISWDWDAIVHVELFTDYVRHVIVHVESFTDYVRHMRERELN